MTEQEKGLFDDEDDEGKSESHSNPVLEYKPVELDQAAATGQVEANPYAAEDTYQQDY